MKNNPLDDIVKCTVEVSSPASNDATFDTILLVVEAASAVGSKSINKTTAISSADELLDYGYTVDDTAYSAAETAFSQNPAPDQLLVVVRQKAEEDADDNEASADVGGDTESEDNPTSGEIPEGEESSGSGEDSEAGGDGDEIVAYENIKTTLARANNEAQFYGIHLTSFRDPDDIQAAMEWAEANEKIFGVEYMKYGECPIKNFTYFRTFCMFSGNADGFDGDDQPKTNEYAALAWMAKCFGYDPGTETWALKPLATIVPSSLGTAEKNELEAKKINRFLRYAGDNITIGGYMVSGEWIDVIRFRDWLKNEMQVNVFNVLKVNRKVPFTDAGIGLVEGAMKYTLEKGVEVGGIATTQYDADDNEIPGFTVTVPRSANLTDAERKSRKLTGCKYTARLAGAIHAVEIYGYLTF